LEIRFTLPLLHLNLLEDNQNQRDLFRTLQNLPSSINATFNATLDRVHRQPENARKTATRVLQWLTNALRPITMIELQHALAVEKETDSLDLHAIIKPEIILPVCKGLVTINEESNVVVIATKRNSHYLDYYTPLLTEEASSNIVRLVHYSADTFLRSNSQFNNVQVQVAIARDKLRWSIRFILMQPDTGVNMLEASQKSSSRTIFIVSLQMRQDFFALLTAYQLRTTITVADL
jgi:hypothetical protein